MKFLIGCLVSFFCVHGLAQSPDEPFDVAETQPESEADFASYSGYATSEDLKIYYKVYGEGHPIILVHGWGASTEGNWEFTGWTKKLRPLRQIISIDVRGHGKSDKPYDQSRYSYKAMSRDVLAVMDHLGIEKADLMGYSMGAFMGAYLLGNHSERFSAMVLGGIGDETPKSANLSYAIAATLRAGKIVSDLFRISDPDFDLEALALSCLQMWPEGFPRKLAGPGISAAQTRVLVINGDEDLPYAHTDQDFVALIPRGRLISIPKRNHLTAFLDPRFDIAVLKFLASRN